MLTYLVIGLGSGIFAGIFGVGGGIVIVPSLILFAKMSQKLASGTSMGALTLPVLALGAWQYWRAGHLDVRASLLVGLGLFIGGFIGAYLTSALGDALLRRAFALLLVVVAARLWFQA